MIGEKSNTLFPVSIYGNVLQNPQRKARERYNTQFCNLSTLAGNRYFTGGIQNLDKERLLAASQMPLVLVALALQATGLSLPLFAVIYEDMNAGAIVAGYFFAYHWPPNLLLVIAFSLVVLFAMVRHMRSKKGNAPISSSALAYSTLLFLIPSWFLVWAAVVDYRYFIITFPEILHVRLGLMSGFYVYTLGCISLVAAQILHPVVMRGEKPTSEEALRWAARNKLGVGIAIFLLAAAPLTLILMPGFPIMWTS